MRTLEPSPWLTWALLVDAATCAAIAAAHLLGGNALADALALPHGLWAFAALGLLASDALAANAWGRAYLALHGVGVLLLAIVEWLAWRHSSAVAAGRAARA